MKYYSIFIFLCFCFKVNAQDTQHKISAALKTGPIFLNFVQNLTSPINTGKYNYWNLEFSIEENKFGIGFTTRYITEQRGFIKNPFFEPLVKTNRPIFSFTEGELVFRQQYFSGFTFFLNKRFFISKQNHRIDFGIGTQQRKGFLSYFIEYMGGGWEPVTRDIALDKYSIFTRLGYSYMISKHFSITTNIEYSRFKMKPSEFWDFNILAGVRF